MSAPARLMALETARLDGELAAGWAVVLATGGPAGEAVALMAPIVDAAADLMARPTRLSLARPTTSTAASNS